MAQLVSTMGDLVAETSSGAPGSAGGSGTGGTEIATGEEKGTTNERGREKEIASGDAAKRDRGTSGKRSAGGTGIKTARERGGEGGVILIGIGMAGGKMGGGDGAVPEKDPKKRPEVEEAGRRSGPGKRVEAEREACPQKETGRRRVARLLRRTGVGKGVPRLKGFRRMAEGRGAHRMKGLRRIQTGPRMLTTETRKIAAPLDTDAGHTQPTAQRKGKVKGASPKRTERRLIVTTTTMEAIHVRRERKSHFRPPTIPPSQIRSPGRIEGVENRRRQ
mmetsp:Transcript_341/g.806  ORF Transcript_341/g.806 Transcript_341/m.806 type:complete len:276 (+) Transcript_341:480-1307(+)